MAELLAFPKLGHKPPTSRRVSALIASLANLEANSKAVNRVAEAEAEEPAGPVVGRDRIRMANSLIDLIFRDQGIAYLGRSDLAHDNVTTIVNNV